MVSALPCAFNCKKGGFGTEPNFEVGGGGLRAAQFETALPTSSYIVKTGLSWFEISWFEIYEYVFRHLT